MRRGRTQKEKGRWSVTQLRKFVALKWSSWSSPPLQFAPIGRSGCSRLFTGQSANNNQSRKGTIMPTGRLASKR
jgi:hypothetical protein